MCRMMVGPHTARLAHTKQCAQSTTVSHLRILNQSVAEFMFRLILKLALGLSVAQVVGKGITPCDAFTSVARATSFSSTPVTRRTGSLLSPSEQHTAHMSETNGIGLDASSIAVSELVVRNADEAYDLHGVLTVKCKGSKSVWVLCHGLCSSSEGTVSRFVSKRLPANTFRFDFGGCGRSGGTWKYAGYDRELSDLRTVVVRLRELGWDVKCVLGHSKGAAAVLRYGEKFDDVELIVNIAGRFHTKETPRSRFTEDQWKELEDKGSFTWIVKGRRLPIKTCDFEERAALDMRKTAEAIKRARVLTIHGDQDETIPVEDAHDFDEVLANNELVVIEGATHRFSTELEQDSVMEALERYVATDPLSA